MRASIHEYEAMGLTFVILTGLRAPVLWVNLVTSSATSLRMKEVSGCEDSAPGGRKAYARGVPTDVFRWVDIVTVNCKCERRKLVEVKGDEQEIRGGRQAAALNDPLRGCDDP
jgi:hypothetical protein